MNYKEKFNNCRTLGEARRLRVTLMDEAETDELKVQIVRAYEERKEGIRKLWEEHCFG